MADRSDDASESLLFRIEIAAVADCRAIAEVHSKAVIAAYPEVLPPEIFDPEFVAPDKMETECRALFDSFGANDTQLKAVVGDTVVGIGTCGDDTQLNQDGTGYIQRVYVDPEWWGRGVGTALVNRAMELLAERGYLQAALQVLENNKKARAFYEKRGWRYEQTVRVKSLVKS